jgi:hypothetical protein
MDALPHHSTLICHIPFHTTFFLFPESTQRIIFHLYTSEIPSTLNALPNEMEIARVLLARSDSPIRRMLVGCMLISAGCIAGIER